MADQVDRALHGFEQGREKIDLIIQGKRSILIPARAVAVPVKVSRSDTIGSIELINKTAPLT
jgi:hypothetical protein